MSYTASIPPLIRTLAFLCIFSGGIANAQTETNEPKSPSDWDKTTYLAPTASYLNNSVYLGRKDSLTLPYFGPALNYHLRSGFSLTATANFTSRSASTKLDMWALEGGYDGNIGEHWLLGAYAGSLNYQKNSSNVRADAAGYAGGYGAFDNDFVSPQLTLTAVFGSKMDWVTAFELEHEFDLYGDRISIIPTAKCNAGTQHYYTAYVVTKLNKKGKPVSRNAVASSDGFTVLDYELSAPVGWNMHRWHLDFIPVYFIPVHPVTLATGGDTYQEKLSNSFTVQLSLSYRFILSRHASTPGNRI